MMNISAIKTCDVPSPAKSGLELSGRVSRPTYRQRPLGDVNTAMRDLDSSDEEVLRLVEQHSLIGFNIALEKSSRSVMRILTESIDHFRQTQGHTALGIPWEEVFDAIFPGAQYTVTGLDLQQGLNCSRGHVQNLADRYFDIIRPARAGRGHTPSFKTASVERWLKGRML